jgi:hypothetical protein
MSLLTLKAHGFQPRLLALIRDKLAQDIAEGRIEAFGRRPGLSRSPFHRDAPGGCGRPAARRRRAR